MESGPAHRDVSSRQGSSGPAAVGGRLPAYEVLTPFVEASGNTYLVNRGYVSPVQGTALLPITPAPEQQVTVQARIRASESTMPGREPRVEAGALQVYSIDPALISRTVDEPLAAGYLQLTDGQPGALGVISLPNSRPAPTCPTGCSGWPSG